MPPKKKSATGAKSPKPRPPTLINGLTKEEISKEQMEEHIVRLREELDREREERNYFQLEKDKINTFWEVTKRKVDEVESELKNLEKAIEDDERRHQVENRVYKQKMKHLLCEHQNTISELKADHLAATEDLQKEQNQLEVALQKEMRAVMVDMQERDKDDRIRELELKHAEEMTACRDNWEKQISGTTAKNEEMMLLLQEEMNILKKNLISEQELHWQDHLMILTQDKNQISKDAKEVVRKVEERCNSIVEFKLKHQEQKVKLKMMKKDLNSLVRENKHLTELVFKAKEENAILERKAKFSSVQKSPMKMPERKGLEKLKTDCVVLEEKISKLQLEKDELCKSFAQKIQLVQEKADDMNGQLENKLQTLKGNLEKTEAQLHSVLSAPNMDHITLTEVTNNAEEYLESRNAAIKDLEYKRNLITKARCDLELTTDLNTVFPNLGQSLNVKKAFPGKAEHGS